MSVYCSWPLWRLRVMSLLVFCSLEALGSFCGRKVGEAEAGRTSAVSQCILHWRSHQFCSLLWDFLKYSVSFHLVGKRFKFWNRIHWDFEFFPKFIRKFWKILTLSSGFWVHIYWLHWCVFSQQDVSVLNSSWNNFLILPASASLLLSNLVAVGTDHSDNATQYSYCNVGIS